LTDRELRSETKLAIQGDKAAFEKLYAAKRSALYFAALALLGSEEDAEDAVQDASIDLFRNIGGLKDPKAVNSWMHRILYARCMDIMRGKYKQVKQACLTDEVAESSVDLGREGNPEGRLSYSEVCEELYEGIRALPEKSREALVLYYFSDMKYREIAAVTDSSVQTVSTNLIRARKILKSYLKEHYPEMASLSVVLPAAGMTGIKLGGGAIFSKLGAAASGAASHVAAGTAGVAVAAAVTYAVFAAPNYEIIFKGDCDCGHINPKLIELKGARPGDTIGEWELISKNGETLCEGSLPRVTDYIKKLEKKKTLGNHLYTLRCVITAKDGERFKVTRELAIGYFDGDI
jgi:RNA polymerase sigma-70 factor (ECF subfamily)